MRRVPGLGASPGRLQGRLWKKGSKLGHGRWLGSWRAWEPGAGPRPCRSVLGAGPHWSPSHQRGSHPRDTWGHSPATSLPGPPTSCAAKLLGGSAHRDPPHAGQDHLLGEGTVGPQQTITVAYLISTVFAWGLFCSAFTCRRASGGHSLPVV